KRVRKLLGPGEPITYVVELKIDGVAISITYENGVISLGATRGDGVTADVVRLNQEAKAKGQKDYANPRNLTAGTLKLLDPRQCAQRKLRLFAYSLGAVEGVTVQAQTEALALLRTYGFPTNPETRAFDGIEEVIAYCDSWEEKRLHLPYETD